MLDEALKSDDELTPSRDNVSDREKSIESVPFSSEIDMMPHGQFPSENTKEDLTAAIVVISNEVGFDEDDRVKYEEYAPFSAEVIPNKVGFVEDDKVKYEDAPFSPEITPNEVGFVEIDKVKYKDAPFSTEKCMTLHGPLSEENSDESLVYRLSYLIKDELLEKGQSEEKFDCCYDDDEMAIVNCQLSPEKIEACNGLVDHENSIFEVDFEGAFGPNMKEFDTEDPWYHLSSKTIENVGHSSEYHRFALEKDNEFGEEFDAVIEQYAKSHKIDSYDDAFGCNIENPYKEGHFIEKTPIDVKYDFAYDDDSDEEIEMKKTQKKKLKVVIRDRPVKNPTLQKLFLYSDVDNRMYIREIKDPLVSILFICT